MRGIGGWIRVDTNARENWAEFNPPSARPFLPFLPPHPSLPPSVHVLGIPLTETRDICSEPGVTCPLIKNKTTTTILHDRVPGLTPGLGVSVRVEIYDETGEKLTCVEVHVDVRTRPLIGLPGWANPSSSSSSSFYSSSSSSSSMMLLSSLPGRSSAVAGVGGGGIGGGMIMAMEQYVRLRMPKALAVAAEVGVGDRRVERGEEGGEEGGHAMLRRVNGGRA